MSPIVELLMQLIGELLKNCPEPEPAKIQFLKKPRLIQRIRLRAKALNSGMSLADFKQGMDELDKAREEATEEDFAAFISQCCAA